jgi:DNA-binding response OmpR family regulator
MANTKTATIMIVEDDAAVRELLVLSLEAHDFETVSAGSVADALARLNARHVDLLLLDLHLGDENGIELLKAIRCVTRYEKLPVILLTGCADRNVVMQVAQIGVQGYLLKHQFSRKELVGRITQLLKDRAATDGDAAPDPAPAAEPPAEPDQFEGEELFARRLQVAQPLLTRAQTLELIKAREQSAALLAAVGGILDCACEIPEAPEKIVNVVRGFRSRDGRRNFCYELFWEHAIATGLIAAQIARLRERDAATVNLAFASGLLHDVGQLIFIEQFDDIYDRVLDTAARLQLPLEQVESRLLLAHHGEAAELLLAGDAVPPQLVESIASHHRPVDSILQLPAHKRYHLATLALADRLAHAMLLGFAGNNCHSPTEKLCQALDVTADTIELIEQQVPAATAQLMQAAFRWSGENPGAEFRQRSLRRFRRLMRPMFVSAYPALDGYRLLLRRLATANHNRPPNLAVVFLADIAQTDALLRNLRDRESDAKLNPLPLILISPLVNPPLDPSEVGGREIRKIPAPFSLFELADMTNSLLSAAEEVPAPA